MDKYITTIRKEYFPQTTIGEVFIDNDIEKFCYQLEDTVRPKGIKVKGFTAIPADIYKVAVTFSNRFQRETIQLYNEKTKEGWLIVTDGICTWTGIRNHGGNTHKNTEGCPLTAYNRINGTTIQGRADKDILKIVKDWIVEGHEVFWEIVNTNQLK